MSTSGMAATDHRSLAAAFAVMVFLLAPPAGWAGEGALGDLKIAPARVPTWTPGVDGGILDKKVAVRHSAKIN
jgi:hypothetical protein